MARIFSFIKYLIAISLPALSRGADRGMIPLRPVYGGGCMEAFTNRTILIQGSRQGTSDQSRLHVVEAGPEDGPLVILLHGFPEFWYGWRKQIGPLAAAGFRVVAPDQRGYGLSDKPRGLDAYNLDRLAGDVIGLIDALGRDRAHVVGHDWGGNVAWWLGIRHA